MLRLHAFMQTSAVNGPGLRSVVWVQGCQKTCNGCFNPATHSLDAGYLVSVDDILQALPIDKISGITFSGGEPFLQSIELAELARQCRLIGLDVMAYSGFTYQELQQECLPGSRALLEQLDILVDGPFLISERSYHPWAGSGNQQVRFLKEAARYGNNRNTCEQYEEILISDDGQIITTGF